MKFGYRLVVGATVFLALAVVYSQSQQWGLFLPRAERAFAKEAVQTRRDGLGLELILAGTGARASAVTDKAEPLLRYAGRIGARVFYNRVTPEDARYEVLVSASGFSPESDGSVAILHVIDAGRDRYVNLGAVAAWSDLAVLGTLDRLSGATNDSVVVVLGSDEFRADRDFKTLFQTLSALDEVYLAGTDSSLGQPDAPVLVLGVSKLSDSFLRGMVSHLHEGGRYLVFPDAIKVDVDSGFAASANQKSLFYDMLSFWGVEVPRDLVAGSDGFAFLSPGSGGWGPVGSYPYWVRSSAREGDLPYVFLWPHPYSLSPSSPFVVSMVSDSAAGARRLPAVPGIDDPVPEERSVVPLALDSRGSLPDFFGNDGTGDGFLGIRNSAYSLSEIEANAGGYASLYALLAEILELQHRDSLHSLWIQRFTSDQPMDLGARIGLGVTVYSVILVGLLIWLALGWRRR